MLLLLLLLTTAPADTLHPVERAIVRSVDGAVPEAVALLERIVNINSGTLNLAGVRAVGDVLRAELDALGFVTRWEDGRGWGRAGHLIAERTGQGPRLLLIGHLDTVFEPDSPFQRFRRIDDTTASGPGIVDMKGGDVILIHALRALRDAGVLDRMSITVVLHGDEEDAGEPLGLARATLVEAARRSRIALGFEDGSGDPRTAVIARRGSSNWILRTTGTPAHSSQLFRDEVGAGAVYEAARVLDGFRTRLGGDPLLTFNPGLALGGTEARLDTTHVRGTGFGKTNVVAGEMVVTGDLRTISPERLTYAKDVMRAVVAQPLPRTTSEIRFEDHYPPMAPTDGNKQLLGLYDQASRDLGFGPVVAVNPAKAGAADVSFAAGHVAMALDALGMSGRDGHTVQETADLRMLPVKIKRAAVLIYRLATGSGGT